LRPLPSGGAGEIRSNGFDVNRMKARKPTPISACTPSTRARKESGRLLPNSATAAPNSARISAHRSIEPSWFPHTPEIL